MGKEAEAAARIKTFKGYQINEKLVKLARPGALVMHCLPAYKGKEIDEATFEAAYLQVKQKYAGDSNGTQPSYLGAEMTMHEVSPSARIQRAI